MEEALDMEEALQTARTNNLVLRNSELELESAKAGRSGILDLDPAQFSYTYGQINTGAQDRFIEIQQDLGSLLTHVQRSGFVKQQIALQQSSLLLTRADLDRKVKTLYQYWVYTFSLKQLSEREHALYGELLKVAAVRFERGESSLLEKSLVETRYAAVLNELNEAQRMYMEAGRLVGQVLQVSDSLVPADRVLVKYMPAGRNDPVDPTLAESLVARYYEDLYLLEQAGLKVERSRFFPALSAGYFNQSIDRVAGFSGFLVGVRFPLWFVPRAGRVKQARLSAEMAGNEMQLQMHRQDMQRVTLGGQVENFDRQIAYYEETALKSAETLIYTATLQFEKQDIEYFEFIQSISVALDIHRAYLDQLWQHNRAAIELEYLLQ